MLDDITIIIKTFKRPECLKRLVDSIIRYYPTITIMILDDSYTQYDDTLYNLPNIHLIESGEFDIGLSYGRNLLINNVTTSTYLLLDDDFIFTDESDIVSLYENLYRHNLDIIGGLLFEKGKYLDFYGNFTIEDGHMEYEREFTSDKNKLVTCNIIPNFFMGKTSSLGINNLWDAKLKLAEHSDFFIRNNGVLKVGYSTNTTVIHAPETNIEYHSFRGRGQYYKKIMAEKHMITTMKHFNGTTWDIEENG